MSIPLNDGTQIPAIAFGTGTALYGRDAAKQVVQALEGGFKHIDTAQAYRNEDSVGEAIKESSLNRSDIYVTTKFGGGEIPSAFRESLAKLELDYVDLYLIHNPAFTPDIPKAWREMERLKEEGLVKSIGVSNFSVRALQQILEISSIQPAVNQISLNPYNFAENKALLEFCAKEGIVIEAYGSLSPIRKPGGPVDAPIAAAAKRLGATPAQVIMLWVRSKGAVVVTTTSNKRRLQEYLGVNDLPPLTGEEIKAIEDAAAKLLSK